MRWLLLILLALSVPAAAGSAQKVFPNGRRLPGKSVGFQFMTEDVQINLSDPFAWTAKGTAGVTINPDAGAAQYSGAGGSTYRGVYIPIATDAGVTYTVSFTQTAAQRIRIGSTKDGQDLLNTSTSNVAGDFTFVFTATSSSSWLTVDKISTATTRISNVTIYRS